jgi:hypothetical protein
MRRNSAVEMSFAGPKNIATDLLCDICGVSYSPIEFFGHVEKCKLMGGYIGVNSETNKVGNQ